MVRLFVAVLAAAGIAAVWADYRASRRFEAWLNDRETRDWLTRVWDSPTTSYPSGHNTYYPPTGVVWTASTAGLETAFASADRMRQQ